MKIKFYRNRNNEKPITQKLFRGGYRLIVYNVILDVLKEITAFRYKYLLLPKM